jgi:hypothetical protein
VVEPEPVGLMVDPLGDVLGPTVLPDGFMALLLPLLTEEPVVPDAEGALVAPVLAVPAAEELPAEAPPPAPPPVCAKASEDVKARADASAIVVSFMGVLLVGREQ